ncbi:unnamed protein product [Protopolystoma xenopodis]|uniref:NOMO sixth transthyretin-like domain-containing protein n=1 Tax=Protopolystoma xenopodis TaxID=117903 RepID=A0A3S5CQ02_9PLAT|nr:unnamed protein product [Protopolystoma xenopodis]
MPPGDYFFEVVVLSNSLPQETFPRLEGWCWEHLNSTDSDSKSLLRRLVQIRDHNLNEMELPALLFKQLGFMLETSVMNVKHNNSDLELSNPFAYDFDYPTAEIWFTASVDFPKTLARHSEATRAPVKQNRTITWSLTK